MSEKLPNDSHDDSSPNQRPSGRKGGLDKSKLGGIAVIALIVVYSLAAPRLNARYGWKLPQIQTDSSGNVRLAKADAQTETEATSKSNKSSDSFQTSKSSTSKSSPKQSSNQSASTSANKSSPPGTSERAKGPLASRMRPSSRSTDTSSRGPPSEKPKTSSADSDLLYGLLRETSPKRYISPEGLQYTPGSAEGHRLEHLRRHTKDDPRRPGSHGVFDGEMEGALKTIDRAYQRAKTGQRTTKKVDDGRTIYTVDMGGRVGYVGGRDGGRKRNPMARRVRIVLEGNRVITAYPM